MIYEHEIPSSSRLYFSKNAKLKRQIKQNCAVLEIGHKDALVLPLFYVPLKYYNSLVFRAYRSEQLYMTGGI